VPPVDIICGGSPCQDLSVAGKRAGLAGERSGLYMEQIRIIREMRAATNNTYPRYMVWENVPGALSSNKGEDFRAVLEEAARCADKTVSIPESKKWSNAGCIVGDGWSIAWRILDAQFWGVPQRRRRIFLVADLGGERAGEVLFKPESMLWHSAKSGEAREGIAADAEGCVDGSVYNESGQGYWMPDFGCLRAEGENRPTRPGHCVVQETKCYAIDALSSNSMKSKNPNSGFHEEDYVKCLDTTGTNPSKNQGGNVIVQEVKCLNPHDTQSRRIYDASGIYPALSANENGGQNRQAVMHQTNYVCEPVEVFMAGQGAAARTIGYSEDAAPTLKSTNSGGNTVPTCVFGVDCRNNCVNDVSATLQAKENGGQSLNYINPVLYAFQRSDEFIESNVTSTESARQYKFATDLVVHKKRRKYIIRRLTPLECERLQGFPDGWTDVPTYKVSLKANKKNPAKNKIVQMSDSARYRMCGNSVAIPCVVRVLGGIAAQTQDIVSS
jgi:DNA (cytosine-5)-methyltransferase 1